MKPPVKPAAIFNHIAHLFNGEDGQQIASELQAAVYHRHTTESFEPDLPEQVHAFEPGKVRCTRQFTHTFAGTETKSGAPYTLEYQEISIWTVDEDGEPEDHISETLNFEHS